MSTLYLFLKTAVVGFAVAAPVGPIGLLTIRIALTEGLFAGYAAGLGVASADAIYAAIAVFGLAAFSTFVLVFRSFFIIAGGCYLVYMGFGFLQAPKAGVEAARVAHASSNLRTVAAMCFLTLANPVTLITYFGIFTALEIPAAMVFRAVAVLGMFVGSLVWWVLLATLVAFTKRHLPANFVVWVNRLSGVAIAIFGLLVIAAELIRL